ncbi:MAG: aminotransferase class III-fold pyridoxal phosphate-dependent enzyme, partial [Halanaerobiaceae bacterium]
MHSYKQFVNPHLGEQLQKLKMDKEFVQGKGCYLFDKNNNKYLDCIANYGAVPFGYNYQPIWQQINNFEKSGEPTLVKPSFMNAAGELAEKLIKVTPEKLKYVTFANSGAEAVEAAFKVCRAKTGRPGILSTENSFHGKTLGALSATGNQYYQKAFQAPAENFSYIPFGDTEALEKVLHDRPDFFAAFIVEPIQGEGGIVTPPEDYLKQAQEICDQHGVALILDEIQTGLGRTGNLFALEEYQVQPDVLLLAKALGGGMIPIGACLSSEDIYNEEFANKHSSTFAGNDLACRIGAKVIDLLTENNQQLISQVKKNGTFLKQGLKELAHQYPDIINSIRGQGYMLGIEFGINRNTFPDSLLGIMAEQELLTPLISSYLLNVENLRVAPTLNGNRVIRVEPPLIMEKKQCRTALDKIENMLDVLNKGNTSRFISYLIDTEKEKDDFHKIESPQNKTFPVPQKGESKFAFLIHPLTLKNYYEYDESLKSFSKSELDNLTSRWNDLVDPFVASRTKITSQTGKKAYGEFIAVPRTTNELLEMPGKKALEEVKAALQLARERGAKIAGLGAYTAVVTMAGLYVKKENIPVTTGNSYTVVASVQAVKNALSRLKINPATCTTAVVGATGSIGGGAAKLISRSIPRLILIGNPENKKSSIKRLHQTAGEIYKHIAKLIKEGENFAPQTIGAQLKQNKQLPEPEASSKEFTEFAAQNSGPILITTDLEKMLPRADITICATNTVKKLITPENVKHKAIICDISRPKNVSQKMEQQRPDVLVIDGGVIAVPGRPSMGWNFGFDQGLVYACMAETMMLALEEDYQNMSIGSSGVTIESILYTQKLAQKHGFEVAKLRSFDRPLSSQRW